MFFPDSLIRRNTWEFYDQLTGSFQYACVVLAHAHVHACNVLFIPHYKCLPVTYLQLSVCTYQRNVYTRICYLYCITSFYTQCVLLWQGQRSVSGTWPKFWDIPRLGEGIYPSLFSSNLYGFCCSGTSCFPVGLLWTMLANVTPRM